MPDLDAVDRTRLPVPDQPVVIGPVRKTTLERAVIRSLIYRAGVGKCRSIIPFKPPRTSFLGIVPPSQPEIPRCCGPDGLTLIDLQGILRPCADRSQDKDNQQGDM